MLAASAASAKKREKTLTFELEIRCAGNEGAGQVQTQLGWAPVLQRRYHCWLARRAELRKMWLRAGLVACVAAALFSTV